MQSEIYEPKPRTGLAIAALILGLISLLNLVWTVIEYNMAIPCGNEILAHFFSVTSIAALLLGISAIIRPTHTFPLFLVQNQKSAISNNRRLLGLLGIIVSLPAALLTVSNLPACGFQESFRIGRDTVAIKTLGTIHQNQAQYVALKNRFATLQELFDAGLIQEIYANGQPVSGYIYKSSDTSTKTYCVQARRVNARCGYRDFIVCEDGIIRYVESDSVAASVILRREDCTPLSSTNGQSPDSSSNQ